MLQGYKTFLKSARRNIFPQIKNVQKNFFLHSSNLHKFSTVTPASQDQEPDFLEMVKTYFDEASKFIEIPKQYLDLIKTCKAVVRFYFPLVRDDGSIEVITGYRAQHSLHLLPTKGGTRYSEHIGKNIFDNNFFTGRIKITNKNSSK